jgi:hypothetical protein
MRLAIELACAEETFVEDASLDVEPAEAVEVSLVAPLDELS